jgi:hypothetical protein
MSYFSFLMLKTVPGIWYTLSENGVGDYLSGNKMWEK